MRDPVYCIDRLLLNLKTVLISWAQRVRFYRRGQHWEINPSSAEYMVTVLIKIAIDRIKFGTDKPIKWLEPRCFVYQKTNSRRINQDQATTSPTYVTLFSYVG